MRLVLSKSYRAEGEFTCITTPSLRRATMRWLLATSQLMLVAIDLTLTQFTETTPT